MGETAIKEMRGNWTIPLRLIVLATLINVALVVASFYPPAIVTEAGQHGFWPYALSHPMEAATVLIALFNFGLVFVTYRLVNSTDKLWEAYPKRIEDWRSNFTRGQTVLTVLLIRPSLIKPVAQLSQF